MNAGALTTGVTTSSFYTNWLFSGAWQGAYSGYWGDGLLNQSNYGYYWSSTANSSTRARHLYFGSDGVYPGGSTGNKHVGLAVRCVMESPPAPKITATAGTIRGGNTLTLTGTNLASATSITVGGAPCFITSNTDTEANCTLPTTLLAGSQTVTLTNSLGTASTGTTGNASDVTYVADTTFTPSTCAGMALNATASITDSRNGQTYTVKKMADNKCWMIDNLKYLPASNAATTVTGTSYRLPTVPDGYMTNDGTNTSSTANSDYPFYIDPCDASSYTQSNGTRCTASGAVGTDTWYGYLYNWYGATAGTGRYATSINDGTQATSSICPSPFRLPSATSNGTTPTSNGTSVTAADFPVLNASMQTGSLTTGTTTNSYYPNWLFSGAWQGVYSGGWSSGLRVQSIAGDYWSSTRMASSTARNLEFSGINSYVYPGNISNVNIRNGYAVRCVLP
jgi:uncharacterized protein (TIGR02145 family)